MPRIQQIRSREIKRYEQPLFPAFDVGIVARLFQRKRLVLDVGCGGGKNLKRILNQSKQVNAIGVDQSAESVKMSTRKNRRAVKSGRLQVVQGSVEALPFASNLFDLVTAVESVHFWNIEKAYRKCIALSKRRTIPNRQRNANERRTRSVSCRSRLSSLHQTATRIVLEESGIQENPHRCQRKRQMDCNRRRKIKNANKKISLENE